MGRAGAWGAEQPHGVPGTVTPGQEQPRVHPVSAAGWGGLSPQSLMMDFAFFWEREG